jgi:hypothetical protein
MRFLLRRLVELGLGLVGGRRLRYAISILDWLLVY